MSITPELLAKTLDTDGVYSMVVIHASGEGQYRTLCKEFGIEAKTERMEKSRMVVSSVDTANYKLMIQFDGGPVAREKSDEIGGGHDALKEEATSDLAE